MAPPSDHQRYLEQHDFHVPDSKYLTRLERELLKKRGRWLQALVDRKIEPYTKRQRRFIRVAEGKAAAESFYEVAWTKFQLESRSKASQPTESGVKRPSKPNPKRCPLPPPNRPECWACNGRGKVGDSKCPTCRGLGQIKPDPVAFERFGQVLSETPGHIYRDDARGNRKSP